MSERQNDTLNPLGPRWAGVSALRTALRVLPLASLQLQWTADSEQAILEVFRAAAIAWADIAYPISGTGWSDERTRILERLWAAGFTASEIATVLKGVSRNAVIGKAHRLGLGPTPDLHQLRSDEGGLNRFDTFIRTFDISTQQHAAAAVFQANLAVAASIVGIPAALVRNQATFEYAHLAEEGFREVGGTRAGTEYLRSAAGWDVNARRSGSTVIALAREPLWPDGSPGWFITLPHEDEGRWQFWLDWYQSRLRGRNTAGLRDDLSRALDVRIASIPGELWSMGPGPIHYEIQRILTELVAEMHEGSFPSTLAELGDIEDQSPVALQFNINWEGRIDADDSAGADKLMDDEPARDRHSELLAAAEELLQLYEPSKIGSNQAKGLVERVHRLIEAVGPEPRLARPGLVIPRGERLRTILKAQERSDEVGAEPPLPPPFVDALHIVTTAYNIYVGLDPLLARYDEARLPPDVRDRGIAPHSGTALIKQAVISGLATERTDEVLLEEAVVAPAKPDPDSRQSRRYSESVRNFCRAAARLALSGVKSAWNHKGSVAAGATSVGVAAGWVATHSAELVRLFPPDSAIVTIIRWIADFVRTWT
jgi:GcrA cell cycle regulator